MENNIYKCLKEVEDLNTITAEKALQFFSYPFFSFEARKELAHLPYYIFHAYMDFIRLNLCDKSIDGIWEAILRKTIMFTQHFSISTHDLHERNIPMDPRVICWLNNALSSRNKCPNPYIRLLLFQLVSFFETDIEEFDWRNITDTFIHTICEINPLFLYPSGNDDEILLDINELMNIMQLCYGQGNLKRLISTDIERFFRKNVNNLPLNQINDVDSNEIRFILHLIKLIGVYAVMTGSITDPNLQISTLTACFSLFKNTICHLVDCEDTFRNVIKRMPFHEYIAETIRDLTSAVITLESFRKSTNRRFISIIDELIDYLGYSRGYFSEPCNLPILLLNRQIQGSTTLILQHLLYLRKLKRTYSEEDHFVEDNDGSSDDQLYGGQLNMRTNHLIHYSDDSENSSSNEFNEDSENSYNTEFNDDSENLFSNESNDDESDNLSNDDSNNDR